MNISEMVSLGLLMMLDEEEEIEGVEMVWVALSMYRYSLSIRTRSFVHSHALNLDFNLNLDFLGQLDVLRHGGSASRLLCIR